MRVEDADMGPLNLGIPSWSDAEGTKKRSNVLKQKEGN
jgi:hypothetical protein